MHYVQTHRDVVAHVAALALSFASVAAALSTLHLPNVPVATTILIALEFFNDLQRRRGGIEAPHQERQHAALVALALLVCVFPVKLAAAILVFASLGLVWAQAQIAAAFRDASQTNLEPAV